mmetsp:Transcript_15060/g.19072  ORF Transcript_15060/g.19072 Transcript_15060/m.19072 type:complete len:353 (-) Transcript_15060:72-1130(-)
MTSTLLSLGCALIAFSPALTLLLLFAYQKAQLIIIVTTSAFCYLLSSLFSSLLNLPFSFIPNIGKWSAFIFIPISVLCQAFFRCAFVKMYLKVESVIEKSIQNHEMEENKRNQMGRSRSSDSRSTSHEGKEEEDHDEEEKTNNDTGVSESSLLRLELNDVSCSIAAGIGFGGMHTILLYGTLLASEGGRKNGTLYQPSCAVMPSLINSAIMAFWFSILDIVWMMVALYGVRMWENHLQYKVSQKRVSQNYVQNQNQSVFTAYNTGTAIMNEWSFGIGRVSGKAALSFMVLSHLIASFVTTLNVIIPANGCIVSLPLLAIVVIGIIATCWVFLKGSFLPESQKQRIRLANHLD